MFEDFARPLVASRFEGGFRLAANGEYFVEIIHIRRKISPFRGKNSADYEYSPQKIFALPDFIGYRYFL